VDRTASADLGDLTIRPLDREELQGAADVLGYVFASPFDERDLVEEGSVFEPERSLGAVDGQQVVACMSAFSFEMSVPGGSLPTAGTTWVGVMPTHRRRGVLSAMMRRHLADVADRGEPLAALWASETPIYGRYGYGPAIDAQTLEVQVGGDLTWAPSAPPAADRVRLIPVEGAEAVLDPIWESVRRRRAGMHVRSATWWRYQVLSTREHVTPGGKVKRVAVAEVDGQDVAYAVFASSERWGADNRPRGSLTVIEMAGVDGAAEAAMWRFLLEHDLVSQVDARRRPVDDALPLLLADSRRVRRLPNDGLHVRVVDVAGALTGRAYAESAGVTIEVVDEQLPANDGTWRIEVAPEGASVTPDSTSTPDLRMPVRSLGSLVMGDVPIRRLAAAGMVEVVDPSVLGAVDAAFRAGEAGWPSEVW
jgi:predicted acetyltransferase